VLPCIVYSVRYLSLSNGGVTRSLSVSDPVATCRARLRSRKVYATEYAVALISVRGCT